MDSFITIIQFFFITGANIDSKNIKFYLGSEEDKQEHKIEQNNRISFYPSFPKKSIYYFETITVKLKNNSKIYFQFLVYIGKENNIIIDLDEKMGTSFELLFYAKSKDLIPNQIIYKNKLYSNLENYGNKKRARIFFANVDPNQLQYINSDEMKKHKFNFSDETYQVLFRTYEKDKYEISLTEMESYLEYNLIFDQIQIELSDKSFQNITKMLKDFYSKYKNYISLNCINAKNLVYDELKVTAEKIINDESYNFISEPDLYKKKFNEELLYLFHIDFYLNQILKLDEEKLINFDITRIKVKNNQKIEEKLYKKLLEDKILSIEQKINILRTVTIFFKNALLNDKYIFNIDYISINNISKENPYYKSKQMLMNIISELNEDSRLFEAFMYFDNKVIQNILEINTQKKYIYNDIFGRSIEVEQPKFITEYGMSLMTVEEIKKHLLDLLPEIIIRVETNIGMRALFENTTNIMIINELKMFDTLLGINEENFKLNPDHYVVPISMEILHEVLSHGKLRYNKKNDNSPLVIRDSKHNFKEQRLMKEIRIDLNKTIFVNKGESGKVLEHYISEDKNIIQKLKEKTNNTNIINNKFWTKDNFIPLYKELGLYNEKDNNSKFEKEILIDDSESDSFEYYDCLLSP